MDEHDMKAPPENFGEKWIAQAKDISDPKSVH